MSHSYGQLAHPVTIREDADLPQGYKHYAGQPGVAIERYADGLFLVQFESGVKLNFRPEEVDVEVSE